MIYTGRMWFDNDSKKPLEQKIRDAVRHYSQQKLVINVCRVHPSDYNGTQLVDGVKVESCTGVRPNNLWLGRYLEDVCAQTQGAEPCTTSQLT